VREPAGGVTHYVHVFYEVNAAKGGGSGGSASSTIPPA
jgi:hypothetical protein